MARPGVMLYFELEGPLKLLSYEEKGRLLDAIMTYGKYGVLPEFDGMLGMAWAFVQPLLDRDGERYAKQVSQKQYAVFSREIKKRGLPPCVL